MENIKVKLTGFWEDPIQMHHSMMRYTMGSINRWKNIEFVYGQHYDKLIIFTRPYLDEEYKPERAITFLTEPPLSLNIKIHPTSLTVPVYLFFPFWDNLKLKQQQAIYSMEKIKKKELLSSVTSELYWTDGLEGYAKRLNFIQLLDAQIEDGFDLYGKKYSGTFFNLINAYKGPLINKYDGLWKYKYHFACENSFYENYYTEKIADPIISECLCFYDGCKNLEEFIDERAFIKIDVNKPYESMVKMIQMINDNEWRKRIKYIRQQKHRLLFELNPLNLIWAVVNDMDVLKMCKIN